MRGCEGPAEFTINCGMYEETHTRTWEAPKIVSWFFLGEQMWSTLTGKASASRWRIQRSTLRQGEPATWGRSVRKDVARKGNFCRTCRVGAQEPTSLRGIATQVDRVPDTEASPTEEPREGKLHAGICAGGVGRPASLPRRASEGKDLLPSRRN